LTVLKTHDNSRTDRRAFLRSGLSGIGGASLSQVAATAQTSSSTPVRIGVLGVGPRGQSLLRILLASHPALSVSAVCDIDESRARLAAEMVRKARGSAPAIYSRNEYDYRNLSERSDVDGLLITTPVKWLGTMAIDGLRTGKHVGVEVSGPQTEEECWNLIAEKNKSGKRLMFLENCCYGEESMMIFGMIGRGLFGDPYYAEGSYVHDVRNLFFDAAGRLAWRGISQRDRYGSLYPQHGLGSPCKWLGINDGDRLESCQTMMTSPREKQRRIIEQFGSESSQAKIEFKQGDFVTSLIQTAKGRMIRIDYSACSTRPYSRYYLLQGTRGCWDSRSGIYLAETGQKEAWRLVQEYKAQYQHSYWRKEGEAAGRIGGHGGIDYYCMNDFVKMIREDKEPWIDVYDAATWSSLIFCSKLSLDRNGARVPMPEFTGGRWKDPDWRKDRMPIS
jgi:hypothetical protein